MGDYQDEIGATGACGEKPMGMTAGQRIAARFNLNHIHFGWLEIAGKIDEAMAETGREWAQRAEAAESYLNNLLAVIHRDGGHYVAQHGLAKAVEDALVLSANRIAAEEKAAALEAALRAIRHIPTMPFPDPAAHSERAFSDAVYTAWNRIQREAADALAIQAARAKEPTDA